jgi:hypothetical protein
MIVKNGSDGMRFVIAVWNEFVDDMRFEEVIPLEFNGRRLAQLGDRNRIDVLVLEGYERLSDGYLGRLRELGYALHDCRVLAQEHAARIPIFVEKYRRWGGIKHYAILRFLVIPRIFPGEDIIAFDGDMIFNCSLEEIEAAVADELYLLGRSTCFGSFPAGSSFFQIFEEHILRANADPQAYAHEVLGLSKNEDFLDPIRFRGTDQAFVTHLHRKGIIDFRHDCLLRGNLFAFGSWLRIHRVGLGPYVYERKNGIDYINGWKIMISHISYDAWTYFWLPMLLSRLFGRENLAAFGRIPHLLPHVEQGQVQPAFQRFLAGMVETFRLNPAAIPAGLNHFSRGAVVRHYYVDSDLSEILNDRHWHKPGVFALG